MTPPQVFDWPDLLARWSQEVIASGAYEDALTPAMRAARWFGNPPATEAQIAALEARLGRSLPPSYRAFLLTTNGWSPIGGFIYTIWSTEDVDWFSARNQDWIDDWNSADETLSVSDADYFVYGDRQDAGHMREEYLKTALEVSDIGDSAIYLLNPQVVTDEGEWEAWFFANWIPGARRYRSFWELMQEAFESLVALHRHQRGEPTPHVDPALGVAGDDFEGLLAALQRSSPRERFQAMSALGNLRDQRALEPLLAIFQDVDEDQALREQAARTLGMLRDKRAVAPLIAGFRAEPRANDEPMMKQIMGAASTDPMVAEGMELFGGMSVSEFLGQMDHFLGKDIAEQLRSVSSFNDAGARVRQGLRDNFNHAIVQGLLELGVIALPELQQAQNDVELDVREQVARVLAQLR